MKNKKYAGWTLEDLGFVGTSITINNEPKIKILVAPTRYYSITPRIWILKNNKYIAFDILFYRCINGSCSKNVQNLVSEWTKVNRTLLLEIWIGEISDSMDIYNKVKNL